MSLIFGFFWFIAGCFGGLFVNKTTAFIFSIVLITVWELTSVANRIGKYDKEKDIKKERNIF